jgi:hypothetical protein
MAPANAVAAGDRVETEDRRAIKKAAPGRGFLRRQAEPHGGP